MGVLVTGAQGFVGRHLMKILDGVPLLLDGRRVDLCNPKDIKRAVQAIKPDAVVHLAGEASVASSAGDPARTYAVNFGGTLNLLAALKATGFSGRFLYISSGDVYGHVEENSLPVTEAHPLRPGSPYAVSKVAAEALCYQWSWAEELDVVIARPFNHIGPGQSARFAVADFAKQIVDIKSGRRKPVIWTGDVDVSRDFTDVRDVVNAYKSLLEHGRSGEIYNICSGTQYSIRSLIETMAALAGVIVRIERDPQRERKNEHRFVCGSYERLHRDTGWRPDISIEISLRDILQHWSELASCDPFVAQPLPSVRLSAGH